MLRVVSYNVHRAIGQGDRRDARRIGAILGSLGADVITLQEVESARGEDHPGQQLEQWAELLGMRCVAGPNLFHEAAGYGNGIITRLDIERVRLHNISVEGLEPRGIVDVVLAYGGLPIRILNTHLGLKRRERRRQMSQLVELCCQDRDAMAPTILTGDFNEWRWISGFFRKLRRRMPLAVKGRTFPSRLPVLRLDQIWCSPDWAELGRRVVVTRQTRLASDHLPICADLALRDETRPGAREISGTEKTAAAAPDEGRASTSAARGCGP